MDTIGSFTLIRNEVMWIKAHLLSWLPHLDQMVFFDGESDDGTVEVIRQISSNHPYGGKIVLLERKNPKNMTDDYQRVFNECLHTLTTDYAAFLHPDMLLEDPGGLRSLGDRIAYSTGMRSFAGDPYGELLEIIEGRAETWKNIYRLRNPDLGLHYFGDYGSANEDCYFSEVTGEEHNISNLPYEVGESGIKILHFSDVRPLSRRIDRMVKCLVNQGHPAEMASSMALTHPRVNFKDANGFRFVPAVYPDSLKETARV